jgi:hypothetical protein
LCRGVSVAHIRNSLLHYETNDTPDDPAVNPPAIAMTPSAGWILREPENKFKAMPVWNFSVGMVC